MILIYMNTREWGGADMLAAGFAKYLESRGENFKIVEPMEGRLRTQLPSHCFLTSEEVLGVSDHVTHVFLPSISKAGDPRFPWVALSKAKVFAWVIHPNDVFSRFFPFSGVCLRLFGYRGVKLLTFAFRAHAALLVRAFDTLLLNDALAVMDGPTSRTFKYFFPGQKNAPNIIPIPTIALEPCKPKEAEAAIHIGYLGRMDVMKWSALRPFLTCSLVPVLKTRPVVLHVVTEGSHVDDLKKVCEKLGISLNLHGYLPNHQARKWLAERCNVAVAMGTAALDLAVIGLPVVVLDPALGAFASCQKKFRYIHDTPDYSVGEYRDFPQYVEGGYDLTELFESSRLAVAAEEGRRYVLRHHNPDICYGLLASRMFSSRLTVSEFRGVMEPLLNSFLETKRHPIKMAIAGAKEPRHV